MINDNEKNQQNNTLEKSESSKLSYHSPRLIHHGSIASLVQNNFGSGSDGGVFDSDTAS